MLQHQILRIFSLLPTFLLASCVTVNLGGGKASTAQGVTYDEPSKPFEAVVLKSADHAWQNKSNGNMISYLSTCHDPSDPSLEIARRDILNGISNLKILNESRSEFNGREALSTVAEGSVDGVRTRLDLLIFKKNNCLYTLSYVGLARSFNENHEIFSAFIQNFKAP